MSEYNCPINGCEFTTDSVQGINAHSQSHDEDVQFPTKRMLYNDLTRVNSKIDGSPTIKIINEIGEFSKNAYISAFGSWNSALEYCSIDINNRGSITNGELLEEISRVSEIVDGQPRFRDMEKYGKYSAVTYHKRFGSWIDALNEAGFTENPYSTGEDHYAWSGGSTKFYKTDAGIAWRKAVFQRDNYTCQDCGDDTGNNLNAHHIKRRENHPELELRIWNGVTLCVSCHAERHKGEEVYEMMKAKALNSDSPNSES